MMKNIEGMTEETFKELDEFIQNNIGLTTGELVKRMKFYTFTEESLEYLLDIINKNPCTFNEIGPFMKRGEKWYNKKKMKKEMIIELKEENIRLNQELNRYKKMLGSQ
tara:strand:+ start:90 stop:413 length:324 start_codon:yes stop_codon:yes gene_type:complete